MLFSNTSLIGQGLSTLCALLEVCSITLSREGRQSLLRVDLQFLRMSMSILKHIQLNLSTTATLRTEESGCYYSYKTSEMYLSKI